MIKTILKEFIKWLIVTVIIGSITWTIISLCKFIKEKARGS